MSYRGQIKKGPKASRATVQVPVPLGEYTKRLAEQIDTGWLASALGSRPLIGSLREKTLKVRKRISHRNSFQTFVRAELSSFAGGTRIDCRFGVHWFVLAFVAIWLLIVGTFFANALMDALNAGFTFAHFPLLLIGLFMLGVGVAIYPMGRYLARNEQDEILQILRDI